MTFHFTVRDDKQIRVIIDTDADCEADDPFAIAQALLTPKFMVKAICAEHFNEAGSMERSIHGCSTAELRCTGIRRHPHAAGGAAPRL